MSDPSGGGFEPKDAARPFSWGASPNESGPFHDVAGPPPLRDPFLYPATPAPVRRTPWLAIVAVTSTALFVAAAALALWLWRSSATTSLAAPSPLFTAADPAPNTPDPALTAPSSPRAVAPAPSLPRPRTSPVPRQTKVTQVGKIPVIDIGSETHHTLNEDLAEQRDIAQNTGRTLLLMTTVYGEDMFRDVDAALADPLLQAALATVRLVRVDVTFFANELDDLGIPTSSHPWFLLLTPNLRPRDGIHGGEWDDDIPRNIAPVLQAFVRGTLKSRRDPWKAPSSGGVQL